METVSFCSISLLGCGFCLTCNFVHIPAEKIRQKYDSSSSGFEGTLNHDYCNPISFQFNYFWRSKLITLNDIECLKSRKKRFCCY